MDLRRVNGVAISAIAFAVIAVTHAGAVETEGTATPAAAFCPGADATAVAASGVTPEAASPEAGRFGTAVRDKVGLVRALRGCGIDVDVAGPAEQPFLTARSGTVLRLTGPDFGGPADVQIFEYADVRAVERDAAQIGPDGAPATMMITWIDPPHFFRAERVIVLYVGEDEEVVKLLSGILGPPFAGGE